MNLAVLAAGVWDHALGCGIMRWAVAHGSRGGRRTTILVPNIVSGSEIAWAERGDLGCLSSPWLWGLEGEVFSCHVCTLALARCRRWGSWGLLFPFPSGARAPGQVGVSGL